MLTADCCYGNINKNNKWDMSFSIWISLVCVSGSESDESSDSEEELTPPSEFVSSVQVPGESHN